MQPEPIPRRQILLSGSVFELGLGGVALGIGALIGVDPLETFRAEPRAPGLGLVATLPMLLAFALMQRSRWRPLVRIRRLLIRSLRVLFAECRVPDLAVLALAAGIGEEVFFRGLVQTLLARWFEPGTALAVASAVFGLAHPITPSYALLAALIGVYLGAVWMAAGNLLVVIVAHAAYDYAVLIWLLRRGARV